MDRVRSLESVLVGDDVEDGVVLTLLDGATEVLASLGDIGITLAHGPDASAIELIDGANSLGVRTVAGLGVVVSKNAGLLDINGSEVVAGNVLGEGLQGRVGVLGLALVPLGHGADDVAVRDVRVGADDLVHGQDAVNVGVVEPEDGVESRDIEVVHVATRFTTSSVVDDVVNRLDAVNTAAAQVGADTNSRSASLTEVGLAGEQGKDTVTEGDADGAEASVHLVVVAARGVGDGATERLREVVPWATTHLRGKGVAKVVLVERVVDCGSAGRLGDGDTRVTNLGRNGRTVARVHGPVPVGHTESGRGVPPALLLVGGELFNDLQDGLEQSLLLWWLAVESTV